MLVIYFFLIPTALDVVTLHMEKEAFEEEKKKRRDEEEDVLEFLYYKLVCRV